MTPEEKAEKWYEDQPAMIESDHRNIRVVSLSQAKDRIKQGYLAGWTQALNYIADKEAEYRNKNIVRRTDYERCLDKGDTLDYDIEPEHS